MSKAYRLYGIPLILSITLAIVLTSINVERGVLRIVLIFIGSLLGTFVLDLDYVIHAYFVDPGSRFSEMLKGYIKHKDTGGFFYYIHQHKDDILDKTLNSALFQIVLGAATIYTVTACTSVLIKCIVLSTYLNSIYRFAEAFAKNNLDRWFWSLKIKTTNVSMYFYALVLISIFLYCIKAF